MSHPTTLYLQTALLAVDGGERVVRYTTVSSSPIRFVVKDPISEPVTQGMAMLRVAVVCVAGNVLRPAELANVFATAGGWA